MPDLRLSRAGWFPAWLAGISGWRQMAVAALAGAGAAAGQAPVEWPVATLAGLVLAFTVFGVTPSPRRAGLVGWAFGTAYFALALSWIVEPFLVDPVRHGWMAPFALVFLAGGLALFWGVAFALARWVCPKGQVWPLLALAVVWALADLARAYVLTGFPWAMPSHALIGGWVALSAAWIGAHGMQLGLFAVAAGLALPRSVTAQGVAARGVGAILAAGMLLLPVPQAQPSGGARPVIRLVQPNAPQHLKWDPQMMPVFFDRQVRFTAEGSADGSPRPDLVIWPETAVPVALDYAGEALEVIKAAAAGVPVVIGMNRWNGDRLYNAAVLLGGDGMVKSIYDKHHLVPFGEYIPLGDWLLPFGISAFASRVGNGYSAGPGPRLMDLGPLGRALPLICYEAVFAKDVTGAPARPDLLMQITNDAWFGTVSGPYQHLAQARLRAIEMGLPMVRVANTGVSAMIDGQGRVLAQIPLGQAGWIDASLPPAMPATLYSRTGDWPVLLLLLILLGLIAIRRVTNTR